MTEEVISPAERTAQFQAAISEAQQITALRIAEKLAVLVEQCDDPEVLVKVYNAIKGTAQAEPEKKTDPNAGLATFNITFTNGSAQVTAQLAPSVGVVGEVQPPHQLAPTPLMLTQQSINQDVIDMLEALDELQL